MIISKDESSKRVEDIIRTILERIHSKGPINANDFETLSYIKKFHNNILKKYESSLMYLTGVFYKASEPKSILEAVYGLMQESIKEITGHDFTPVQAKTYQAIKKNQIYSFSAPTSTGKSHLFRKIVQEIEHDVVIVLPSRALIAEYLYAIKACVNKEVLVLQFIEDINKNKAKRRIYIVTPERGGTLFEVFSQLDVELILFDEAQLVEDELRGLRFDAFVHNCLTYVDKAKIVFAHPFVSNPDAQLARHRITENCDNDAFKQQNVGKIHVLHKQGSFETFSPYCSDAQSIKLDDIVTETLKEGGSILVYVSKSKLYTRSIENEFAKYFDLCTTVTDEKALKIIEQVHKYIGDENTGHKQSRIVTWMKQGIVIHHGSMPLKMRLLIEQFVNGGYARLCFATATLIQGINMPFDVVWINNFQFQGSKAKKNLDLKNLIGRAGRTTRDVNSFDYGYVIIEHNHKKTYSDRIKEDALLSTESKLFSNILAVSEDEQDIIEAFQNDEYDISLRITTKQIQRIRHSNIFDDVKYLLNQFISDSTVLSADEYYKLKAKDREKIKDCFKRLYSVHLRRAELTPDEQKILSTAIPIILWRIQGKSFKEILSLRCSYILRKQEQKNIEQREINGEIKQAEKKKLLSQLTFAYSAMADYLPNKKLRAKSLFNKEEKEFDYDRVVYDTYDYIDKVINISISDPICAVLQLYYDDTNDERALTLSKLIRYGTDNATEIWLLKYGYSLDDMEWLIPCVNNIDEFGIIFNEKIKTLNDEQKEAISRYL